MTSTTTTTSAKTRFVPIDSLVLDPRLQARDLGLVEATVSDYARHLAEGKPLPAVEAVSVGHGYGAGETLYLTDGWHRVAAARRAGLEKLAVVVHPGESFADAARRAAGANSSHGLPRTPADKRRAVRLLLALDGLAAKSDRYLADLAKVGHDLVAAVRREVLSETASTAAPLAREGRDGKVYPAKPAKPTKEEPVVDVSAAVDAALSRCQRCGNSGTLRDLDPNKPALCRSCALTSWVDAKTSPTRPAKEGPTLGEVFAREDAPKQRAPFLNDKDAPQHWDTPPDIVAVVCRVAAALGGPVALDPCASSTSTVGFVGLRVEDGRDGLAEDWHALAGDGLVYVNPPWDDLGPWISKAQRCAEEGTPVLILLPYRCYRSDVEDLSRHHCAELRVDVAQRVRFRLRGTEDPGGCPFPVALWLLVPPTIPQPQIDEARAALTDLGPVLDLRAQKENEAAWLERRVAAMRKRQADERQGVLPLATPPAEKEPAPSVPQETESPTRPAPSPSGSPRETGAASARAKSRGKSPTP